MNDFEKGKIIKEKEFKEAVKQQTFKEKKFFIIIYIVLGLIFIAVFSFFLYFNITKDERAEKNYTYKILKVYQLVISENNKKESDPYYEYKGTPAELRKISSEEAYTAITKLVNLEIDEDFYILDKVELEGLGLFGISDTYLVNYEMNLVFTLKPLILKEKTMYTVEQILNNYKLAPDIDYSYANAPELLAGMIPVIYNEATGMWEKTENIEEGWFNYDAKKWANVMLSDNTEERMDGSMFVWIPRYAYKISEKNYHTSITGIVDIKFLDGKTNECLDGTIIDSENINPVEDYVIHPAFTAFGGLTGIWVSKYEASNLEYGDIGGFENEENTTSLTYKSLPDKYSWVNIDISTAYVVSRNFAKNAIYGLDETQTVSHLLKNTEWGAIAYLAQSKYGRNNNAIINNNYYSNSNGVKTGYTAKSISETKYNTNDVQLWNTKAGVKGSTTGNVYGIYDMVGGASERVAAYLDNGSRSLMEFGKNLYMEKDLNYVDVYKVNGQDVQTKNYYYLSQYAYGDALYETSLIGNSKTSWFNVSSEMVSNLYPFFFRGGQGPIIDGNKPGIFYFGPSSGGEYSIGSFRIAIIKQ